MDLIKKLLACILMLAKEPIVGPLWFLCVLFESLVGYCILTFLIVKFNLNKNIRLVLILIVTVLSVYMTYRGGTIPRVSNVPAAMLCICIGQMCSENKVSYTNIYIFVICTVLLLSGVLFEQSISFNSNKFENPMYFVGSVLCGMYFVFYISKKIAEIKVLSLLSKVLIALGQSSLYIMALHLSCFKIVDYIIDIDSLAQLTPMADNLIEVIVFALFGLGVPYVVWKMRNVIWSRLKKQ